MWWSVRRAPLSPDPGSATVQDTPGMCSNKKTAWVDDPSHADWTSWFSPVCLKARDRMQVEGFPGRRKSTKSSRIQTRIRDVTSRRACICMTSRHVISLLVLNQDHCCICFLRAYWLNKVILILIRHRILVRNLPVTRTLWDATRHAAGEARHRPKLFSGKRDSEDRGTKSQMYMHITNLHAFCI
jgi:hypothetical protein